MKVQKLINILESGKKPFVKLTDVLWDESFGCENMIARVESYSVRDHGSGHVECSFTFDYNQHRINNLNFQSHDWFIDATNKTGTMFESKHCHMKEDNLVEDVSFDLMANVPVELVSNKSLLGEYILSESSKSYVEWLEERCGDPVKSLFEANNESKIN